MNEGPKEKDPPSDGGSPRGPREGLAEGGPVNDDGETGTFASPPCYMHELDPSYLGYMGQTEILELMNLLLEAERAGAKGVARLAREASPDTGPALHDVAADEARFCTMLANHIERLGGTASRKTGGFYQKLMAEEGMSARLTLLNRGQGWVAKRLREALPRVHDQALYDDLKEMLSVHESNIALCDRMAGSGGATN